MNNGISSEDVSKIQEEILRKLSQGLVDCNEKIERMKNYIEGELKASQKSGLENIYTLFSDLSRVKEEKIREEFDKKLSDLKMLYEQLKEEKAVKPPLSVEDAIHSNLRRLERMKRY